MLLDRDVQAGVVVDRHGVYRGLVNVDQIAAYMRDTARPSDAVVPPASGAELAEEFEADLAATLAGDG